jgi:hypothetical protein
MTAITRSVLCVAVLAGAVTFARADRPEFFDVDDTFEEPFISELCGFPVELNVRGTLAAHGNAENMRFTLTYTNLETGRSVEVRRVGRTHQEEDAETGTIRFTLTGARRLVIPGGGTLISAGRYEETISFDPEEGEVVDVEFHGRDDSFDELLCELLSE